MSPTLAARRARRALWVFMAVGSALLLIGLMWGIAAILNLTQAVRDTQLEGSPTGQRILAASDRILDCTDAGDESKGIPPGECFKESQRRTADAVGNINRVAVLAAACAAGLPDGLSDQQRVIRVQRCLIDQLAVDQP